MKKKIRFAKSASVKKTYNWQFDNTEFMLLAAFAALSLLLFFSWQTGILNNFGPVILGVSTSR